MQICRFNEGRLGVIQGDKVFDVTSALGELPILRWPSAHGDHFIRNIDRIRKRIEAILHTADIYSLEAVRLLSPVANPSKIIAAPVNYLKHAQEARADGGVNFDAEIKSIDQYGLFLKSNTSIVGPSQGICLPKTERRIDHEIELVLVIGREGYLIREEDAMDYVAGYCIGLDMTMRGPEDRSWRKSYDSFTVLGPALVTTDEVKDASRLEFELNVNGQTRQKSNTSLLIYGLRKLIAYASSVYKLFPGDVLMTGTPEGVGPVKAGDVIDCEFEAVGKMRVEVGAVPVLEIV